MLTKQAGVKRAQKSAVTRTDATRVTELALALKTGDTSVLSELERATKGVCEDARRAAGCREIDDLPSDLSIIWEAAASFDARNGSAFTTFLWRIVRDKCCGAAQKLSRQRIRNKAWYLLSSDDYAKDPEWLLMRAQESGRASAMVGALLTQMNVVEQTLVQALVLDEQMTLGEVANTLGISCAEARDSLRIALGLMARGVRRHDDG